MSNEMIMIGLILLVLGIAKLPMYGLHIWLPKVHVEASIIGSMVLAGGVLKLGILYV
jgi:NADH-ubiquinone oxidoreductase chain 4